MTTDTEPLVVETRGLTKRYGDRAVVDGVDLRVPRGTAFGFLGPNGAGKTTVVRLLLGLTRADAGQMSLLGRPVPADRQAALARVGAIVEEPRFLPFLTGRENLRIAAAAREPEAHGRIDAALERVHLGGRGNDRVKTYSMGMRQRLGVARCLIADPDLLVLDEPTNGLDPAGIQEFRWMVRELVEQEGRTVFLSSHLLGEVEKTCDQVAIVDHGRVLAQGPVSDIAGGGAPEVTLGVTEPARAATLLAAASDVVSATDGGEGDVRVVLRPPNGRTTQAATAALVRRLVQAEIDVHRVEPHATTLEQRFLDLTTRLGDDR